MNILKSLSLLSLLCCSSASFARCAEEKLIEHQFEISDIKSIQLNALAGELRVQGSETDTVAFKGRACADDKEYLKKIKLDISKHDSVLKLTVILPHSGSSFGNSYAYMDINLVLPSQLPITINDSSGNIRIDDAFVTQIDDSSGDVDVRNSAGDLTVEDSSGRIEINDHKGELTITDSSGDIELSEIEGNIIIPADSSGEIDIDKVGGFVRIDNDSSGSIDIEEVATDITIGNDGSGDISLNNVTGSVIIQNDGSGRVRVTRVSGDFTLESKGSGDVKTRGIDGEVLLPRNKRDS